LRRLASGLYETRDGRYRVERVDSLGEGWSQPKQQYVEVTTSVWVITEQPTTPGGEWVEISGAHTTKRNAVAWLRKIMEESRDER
jgi:hypothetical protein